VGAVHRCGPVVEIEPVRGLGQTRGQVSADRVHARARSAAGACGEADADVGGEVDGCGCGEGQAQPLVDGGADSAGFGSDAGWRQQEVLGCVLGAEVFA
jgi:hypothetical protein